MKTGQNREKSKGGTLGCFFNFFQKFLYELLACKFSKKFKRSNVIGIFKIVAKLCLLELFKHWEFWNYFVSHEFISHEIAVKSTCFRLYFKGQHDKIDLVEKFDKIFFSEKKCQGVPL